MPMLSREVIPSNLQIHLKSGELMGLDTPSNRRNYCKDGKSPKVVSASPRLGSKVQKRDDKGKPTHTNCVLKNPRGEPAKPKTSNSLSPRKIVPSKLSRVTSHEEPKRCSVYQSSESVRQMKKLGVLKGTRKIQSLRNSDCSLTFTIVDSLSRPNAKEVSSLAKRNRSTLVSLNAVRKSTSVGMNYILPSSSEMLVRPFRPPENRSVAQSSSDGLLDICLDSEDLAGESKLKCDRTFAPENDGNDLAEDGFLDICLDSEDLAGEPKFKCDRTFAPENDGNDLAEKDSLLKLSNSASVKEEMSKPSCNLESNPSKANSKGRISPLRKMLGPTLKSKSLRNPSVSTTETSGPTTTGSECIKPNKMLHKSLLQDFSKMSHKAQCNTQLSKTNHSPVRASPVHLHGLLRLECKHDMPFFVFSLNDLEDVLIAKTWRMDTAFNWMYTFYSIGGKRKSNSGGWGTRERHRESSMVGQMQASCYLHSEVRNAGSLDNSTVMEFELYDIAHTRKSFAVQDPPIKDNSNSNLSAPCVSSDLHPHLEVAAIVIQVPFEQMESLRDKIGDKVTDVISNSTSPVNVKVITTTGTHGLPNTEKDVPSPILKRWRSGGGCDCGGWDMACPVSIFSNSSAINVADSSSAENQQPFELFSQGAKEKVPALTITFVEEGQYLVDFHAQLSTLQAFSICVALLHHAEEVHKTAGKESHRLHCKSLKSLLQEEVRILVEAVAQEEKRKLEKRKEGIPPYLAFNPPFSPIGRV